MATISLKRRQSNSIIKEGSTTTGDAIVNVTVGGASFISEDLSKQITTNNVVFNTSYVYLQHSLEVFINGMKLSAEVDFEENLDRNGFALKQLNMNFNKILQSNTYLFIKYIKE